MFEGYVPTESEEQIMVFQWADLLSDKVPELTLLHHIPNGGLRHPATAARMKAEGVKAGVPDLFLPVPRIGYHGLYIEMKKADHSNRPSREQRWWIEKLQRQGYCAEVAYGSADAIYLISTYLGIENV